MIPWYSSGMAGFSVRGSGGAICRWPISTSPNEVPAKGSLPVAIWNMITPSE